MAKPKADLDLHKLEIFYWVAEHKSFSQAAELLSLSQPTISAHVQELEAALGGKLLYRIPGKVSLTPLGQMLLECAKTLVAFKRDTVAAVEQFQGTLTGELWVGGSSIPGEYLLPQKLGEFTKLHPKVIPILRIGDSAEVVNDILDGKVEIAFVGFRGDDERLIFDKLWHDEMVLAVPKGHPWSRRDALKVADLRSEKFISREHGSGTLDSLRDLLANHSKTVDEVLSVSMVLGSSEAVKNALMNGFGFSILSRISIQHELKEGTLVEVPVRGLKMERDFYEVHHSRRPLHPIARVFHGFLRNL